MKQIVIALATLNAPRDICRIMEYHDAKCYTYGFHTNGGKAFNFGKAADNEWMSGTFGNRIYRKAGGIEGWVWPMNCSSAKKMSALMAQYMPDVTKDDVVIIVNDYTQELLNEDQYEIDRFLLNEENNLVRDYEKTYGTRPILNIQDTRSHPDYKQFYNNLFEEIEI